MRRITTNQIALITHQGNSKEKGLLKMALEILLPQSGVFYSVAELKNDVFRWFANYKSFFSSFFLII